MCILLRKVWPYLCQFLKSYVAQHYMQISYTKFYQSQSMNAESTCRTFLMPVNKRWVLLRWYSQNPWSHNNFLWTVALSFPPPQNWMKNVESVGKIFLCLSLKYGFSAQIFTELWIAEWHYVWSCMPVFTQMCQWMWKVQENIFMFLNK